MWKARGCYALNAHQVLVRRQGVDASRGQRNREGGTGLSTRLTCSLSHQIWRMISRRSGTSLYWITSSSSDSMWQETMAWWKQITFQLNTAWTIRKPGFISVIPSGPIGTLPAACVSSWAHSAKRTELSWKPSTAQAVHIHPIGPAVALSCHCR